MIAQRLFLRMSVCTLIMLSCLIANPTLSQSNALMAVDNAPPKTAEGNLKQELQLAGDYMAGRGVPRDLAQSAYWYRKAADQGLPAAQVQLGYFYLAGLGVERDAAQAAKWFERALGLRKEFDFENGVAIGNDNVTIELFKGRRH